MMAYVPVLVCWFTSCFLFVFFDIYLSILCARLFVCLLLSAAFYTALIYAFKSLFNGLSLGSLDSCLKWRGRDVC